MSLVPAPGIVISASPPAKICRLPVQLREAITIPVRLNCMVTKRRPETIFLDQGSVSTFVFQDRSGADLSGVTEVIFTMRQGSMGGAEIYRKTLTSGDISLSSDNEYRFTPTNAEAAAWPAGTHYYETWVTDSGGIERAMGYGPVKVTDTVEKD